MSITLTQIISRARSRSEKGQFDKCPRILFHHAGQGDVNEWLEIVFEHDGRVRFRYTPRGKEFRRPHEVMGYIPREILAHASEIQSGDDPAALWAAMHKWAPHASYKLLNGLVELWRPWVLRELDLLEEAA